MRIRISTILLLPLLSLSAHAQYGSSTGTLEITFTGIRNGKGLISIGINDGPEGWPRKPDTELNWRKTNAANGVMTVTIPSLPIGTYAVSVLDDENSDLEMDSFLGIPREGFGFSNNPKAGMSEPSFEECAFEVTEGITRIKIQLKYIGK